MSAEPRYAEGPNFYAVLREDVALLVVFRRPDLSLAEGAECARLMGEVFERLAREPGVGGVVFDLSEAPPVMGPKTLAWMEQVYRVWSGCSRRLALVLSKHPVQLLQHERLAAMFDERQFARFRDQDEAMSWAHGDGARSRVRSGIRYKAPAPAPAPGLGGLATGDAAAGLSGLTGGLKDTPPSDGAAASPWWKTPEPEP